MDYIDKMIKKRVESEEWTIPKSLDNTINCVLNDLPKRKVYKRTPLKILVPVALIITLTTTTVFAVGLPPVKNTINSVISFFHGESVRAKYMSNKQNFEKFNNAVSFSVEDKGIKLTVDNIAVDDNFLNIFYTIESNKPIPKKNKNEYYSALFTFPIIHHKINGKTLITNNNDDDGYFESAYKLKGMKRLSISGATLKDNFPLEISTNEIFDTKGKWTISTTVDKTLTKADTKTVTPNQTANIKVYGVSHKITIDKVSISPFGSQILISEWVPYGKTYFNQFALFDENGNSLDVLNTAHMHLYIPKKTTNAFEFVKANKDMKYITLVPIQVESPNAPKRLPNPVGDINKFPIVLKVNETGNIVVDNIVFTQNQINIIYHQEGVTRFADSAFQFYDKDGKEIDLGNFILETSVDRVNGKYTQTLTASKSDLSKSSFDFSKISKVSKISTYADEKFDLLYDQQVRIELNK